MDMPIKLLPQLSDFEGFRERGLSCPRLSGGQGCLYSGKTGKAAVVRDGRKAVREEEIHAY